MSETGLTYIHVMIIIITSIFKAQNLVPRDYSKHLHTHTHTHTHTQRHLHTQAFWLYKAKYTQLKMGSKRLGDFKRIKIHRTENMAGLQLWAAQWFISPCWLQLNFKNCSQRWHKLWCCWDSSSPPLFAWRMSFCIALCGNAGWYF